MDFGVCNFPTHYSIRPEELGRALEERGFESVFFTDHSHIPVSRKTPAPSGKELSREYMSSFDPFLSLSAVAAVTTKLRLGTGVCLLVVRDPIITAKEVATIDQLSNGRFLFGIGGGWNVEEMADHGTDFKTRWRLLRERVLAMKELWTKEEVEFHGEFVNFDKCWQWPKPVQKPHPPILFGGDGPTTFDRVLDYCDGWAPLTRPNRDPIDRIPELRSRLEEAGRDPHAIPVSIFFAPSDRGKLNRLRDAGVSRAVFGLPSAPRDVVLRILDDHMKQMQP